GIKVVEIAGIGPGPFCAMMLADMGAEVVCIDRPRAPGSGTDDMLGKNRKDATQRGRPMINLDLKKAAGVAVAMELIERADALIEGFRPGVMERLGLGPHECLERNPRLLDGAALLMANIYSRKSMGMWTNERGSNALDGGAPWYGVYECADGRFVAVGAIEPQFYAVLLEKCGIEDPLLKPQWKQADWPKQRERLAAIFRTQARDEWCARAAGSDACLAPVLDLDEASIHPHCAARGTFIDVDSVVQPAAAPRFSRTALESRSAADAARAILASWNLGPAAEKLLLGAAASS